MTRGTTWLAALVAIVFSVYADAQSRIAIIIDDLGYERVLGERTIRLPGPIAVAVLPGTPNGRMLAEFAHQSGKEVLLHLPLESMNHKQPDEPGLLQLDMTRARFSATVSSNLASIPHVSGINTHRGSLLTRHPGHMDWLMDAILERGDLFFVDSYTTADSIALRIASERGIPAVRRDVFLDTDPTAATIESEFARLKKLADDRGFAVGIGHPYPVTIDFLESALPRLASEGYTLVTIGDLVFASESAGDQSGARPAVAGQ